jgi:hypothetical protein
VPFSIRPRRPKTNPSTKAEVEDGEIEDAKMTDVAMKGTEKAAKSKQEPSEKAEKAPQQAEPSAAGPETAKEPIPSEKPALNQQLNQLHTLGFARTRCFSARGPSKGLITATIAP